MAGTSKPTFLQACKSLYATVIGLPTLYLDEAKPGADYPRCVMTHRGERPTEPRDYNDENEPTESRAEVVFEFQVSNDPDGAETLAIALMDAFKPDELPLSMDPEATIFRGDYHVGLSRDRDPNGNPVYFARVGYYALFGTNY